MNAETRDVDPCCEHGLQWHHETRGCGYHGFSDRDRCPCLLPFDEALAEHERIAQAIEAKYLGADFGRQYDGRESPDAALHHAYDEGLQTAAEIAREGGAR